jgi:cupin fold WbuC family metalloprotein
LKYRKTSPEVFSAVGSTVAVDRAVVGFLKRRAALAPRRRARLCAHEKPVDSVQEMMICLRNGVYIAPHKHVKKTESFHVVAGRLDVVVFNDAGGIQDVVRLGPYASGLPFFYRRRDNAVHTVVVRSAFAVFHETTNGPFVQSRSTMRARWGADESDPKDVRRFLRNLDAAIRSFSTKTHRQRR